MKLASWVEREQIQAEQPFAARHEEVGYVYFAGIYCLLVAQAVYHVLQSLS
jgi:hypothetical protein